MHSRLWTKSTCAALCLSALTLCTACGAEDDDGGATEANNAVNNNAVNNDAANNAVNNTANNDAVNNDAANNDAVNNDAANNDAVNNDTNNDDEPEVAPTEEAALAQWVQEGSYLHWPAESGAHPSTGPHFGQVRTWVNPTLHASLEAGGSTHPVGSVAVKELYGDSGDTALGYSVMVKVSPGSGGDTWYWNETYNGSVYASSVGAGLCTGCHADGADFILTPFPLQ